MALPRISATINLTGSLCGIGTTAFLVKQQLPDHFGLPTNEQKEAQLCEQLKIVVRAYLKVELEKARVSADTQINSLKESNAALQSESMLYQKIAWDRDEKLAIERYKYQHRE